MTNDGRPEAGRLTLTPELRGAVRKDDIDRIEALVEADADVNGAAPKTGYTPLMWATSAEATRMLLHAGASVHARDREGHTPLMWVISRNNVPDEAARIANALIDAGADIKVQDNKGQTPLFWARLHRDRLREPRLRRIAEELVSVLQAASDARSSTGTAGSGKSRAHPEVPERAAAVVFERRRLSKRLRWIVAGAILLGVLACIAAGVWMQWETQFMTPQEGPAVH